jgi:hypothetical protein
MSNWYKKAELAKRFSIFYCASLVSGAVGGLIGKYKLKCLLMMLANIAPFLAGLILENMQNRPPYPAWKWLFLSMLDLKLTAYSWY